MWTIQLPGTLETWLWLNILNGKINLVFGSLYYSPLCVVLRHCCGLDQVFWVFFSSAFCHICRWFNGRCAVTHLNSLGRRLLSVYPDNANVPPTHPHPHCCPPPWPRFITPHVCNLHWGTLQVYVYFWKCGVCCQIDTTCQTKWVRSQQRYESDFSGYRWENAWHTEDISVNHDETLSWGHQGPVSCRCHAVAETSDCVCGHSNEEEEEAGLGCKSHDNND